MNENYDDHNFYDNYNEQNAGGGDPYGDGGQDQEREQTFFEKEQQYYADQQASGGEQQTPGGEQQASYYGQQAAYGGQQAAYGGQQASYYGQQAAYYGQQPYPYGQMLEPETKMSVGRWFGTLLLAAIPVVNLIMLIIWAVSGSPKNAERKNWARAQLIWVVIGTVLGVVLTLVGGMYMLDDMQSETDAFEEAQEDANDDDTVDASAASDDADWLDMRFTFDGEEYALPFAYSEIAGNGWIFSDELYQNGYVLNPGDSINVSLDNPSYDAAYVYVDIVNTGDSIVDISECDIYAFDCDVYYGYEETDVPQMNVAGGPSLGMDKEEVFELLGDCSDDNTSKMDGMEWYHYYNSDYSKYLYVTWEEDYGVTGLSLTSYEWTSYE